MLRDGPFEFRTLSAPAAAAADDRSRRLQAMRARVADATRRAELHALRGGADGAAAAAPAKLKKQTSF